MQSRVGPMEEGKDPTVTARTTQSRVFPQRLLQFLAQFLLLCICFSVISIYMIRYFGVNNAVAVATALPSFQPCVVEEPTSLEQWIKPPSNLLHKMTDKELLWRASFTSRVKKYPFERVPKIAFMFLTKGPLPLAPLWERFLKGHEGLYSIYIHSLPSFQVDFPSSSVFYRRQIPSQIVTGMRIKSMDSEESGSSGEVAINSEKPNNLVLIRRNNTLSFDTPDGVEPVGKRKSCREGEETGNRKGKELSEWGKMSMCDAERRLLANALLDISNEWFVLLSESCIPLYNFSVIYHYIKKSKYSFIGAFDDPGPYGRGRYNQNMAPEVNVMLWRKGSQWFEINRKLAVYIVEDTTFYPKFDKFCKPACYVDEHYFPTMLTIQASNLLANRSITWVDWSRGGAHPATFGRADITEEFLKKVFEGHSCLYNNQPSSVCFLFARKFAPSALEPLLLVAPKYFGY
ncbi:hypothetical protein TEA_002361 [Camellia sinensis var. sinensis]|uniref:Uncharacterized protein n=1 Tax=Camellia sinensis var. sinensis TaxID=542762 RepID=A0A4S4EST2_CAMSN|nr:hypothetical protein TEA_002361 [Camellia sinensis var. sinensis]